MLRRIRKALRLTGKSVYRRGLAYGAAAGIEHTDFLSAHRYGTIVDAGANRGQFALAARALQPDVQIISFEPLPEPAVIFSAVFSGDERTLLRREALGDHNGEADIHLSRRQDNSSLLAISARQVSFFPGTDAVGKMPITVVRLDDVAAQLPLVGSILLKIDVQGFELEVLRGAERTLQSIADIYVELSFLSLYENQPLAGEVIEWLAGRGFDLRGVYHVTAGPSGTAIQADFHFRARNAESGSTGRTEV